MNCPVCHKGLERQTSARYGDVYVCDGCGLIIIEVPRSFLEAIGINNKNS